MTTPAPVRTVRPVRRVLIGLVFGVVLGAVLGFCVTFLFPGSGARQKIEVRPSQSPAPTIVVSPVETLSPAAGPTESEPAPPTPEDPAAPSPLPTP